MLLKDVKLNIRVSKAKIQINGKMGSKDPKGTVKGIPYKVPEKRCYYVEVLTDENKTEYWNTNLMEKL